MLLLPILLPMIGGILLLFVPKDRVKIMSYVLMFLTVLLVVALPFVVTERLVFGNFPFGVIFALDIDGFGIFFSYVFVLVWSFVLPYVHRYFQDDKESTRFFAFYITTLGALVGVAYANNLITLYMFFEFLGLCCIPLIAHERSEESMRACRKYLYYSVAGAFMGLTAIFYIFTLEIPQKFTAGGIPELLEHGDLNYLFVFTIVAVVGFACKTGMFPLHAGLIAADPIAPDPATAVLSGITTKAGVIVILRLLYYVVGADVLRGTFVQTWGLGLSMLTIFMGSLLASREKELKSRLAYSTISQVSYVIFGLFLFHPLGIVGAMLQVLFHALAKTTLFLSAGTMIHETGEQRIAEFEGCGHALKKTYLYFAVASLSLIGLPFTGGFVSKWYIAVAAVKTGGIAIWGAGILVLSALLTAYYLFPIIIQGFLPEKKKIEATWKDSGFLVIWIVVLGVFPLPLIDFCLTLVEVLGLGGGL